MRPEATAIIEGDDDQVRQLLACWPAAVTEWERYRRKHRLLEVWAEVAGVDIFVVLADGMRLIRCGLALDGGLVAPEAAGYVMRHALTRAGQPAGVGERGGDGARPGPPPRPSPPSSPPGPKPNNVRPFRPRGNAA